MAAVFSDREPRVLEDLAGNDQPMNLARSFVDFGDAGIAEIPLDRVLLRVAVPAMHLGALRRAALPHLAREEFCLGGLEPVSAPRLLRRVLRRRGAPRQ